MNFNPDIAFESLPNTLDMSKLERLKEPTHQVLSNLIHGCSPNTSTSTMATAALVMSLWQLRGQAMSEHVPSTILLNAGEAPQDPVDDLVRMLTYQEGSDRPGPNGQQAGLPILPEKARGMMHMAMQQRHKLGHGAKLAPYDQENARIIEDLHHEAQKSAHGSGCSRAYSRAWDEAWGLVTDQDDEVILRLHDADDRAAFRRDVLGEPDRLLMPKGIGRDLRMTSKAVSFSGSLTVDQWDDELVMGIIKLGLPVVFLPHVSTEALVIPNPPAMESLPDLWRFARGTRAKTSLPLPPIDWFEAHACDMRRRLHLLPGTGTYGFALQHLLHQLGGVCGQIAHYAGNNVEAAPKDIGSLYWDLHCRVFRGIALGVAALAWHCLGFDPGCPREKAVSVLKHIREQGSVRMADLLLAKGCRVDATTRDVLLDSLAAEDLIRVEDKTVTATTFGEFVEALHGRAALPDVGSFLKTA